MQDLRKSALFKKNRNRLGGEIHAFIILFWLSNKLIPKRIRHRKSKIGRPNCIYSYLKCVLEYIEHLGQRILLVKFGKTNTFADF